MNDIATAIPAAAFDLADGSPSVPTIIDAMTDTRTLTLRKPIAFDGAEVTTLDLREPRAGEMLQWAHLAGIEANIAAVSIVSGQPMAVIGQLVARDILDAAAYVNAFGLLSIDQPTEVPATLDLTLRQPIEHGGATIHTLSLSEPTATQLIEWDKADGIAADLKIISAVTGVSEVALRKLVARDLVAAGGYLANFLVPGLPAGVR